VIGFDEAAQIVFKNLRAQKLRLGTQNLRIAAITLSQGATLITRNQQDFGLIPMLKIEDWSLPDK
jgi:tRNA(fMet)-specific endonuclease VapC